MSMTLLLLSLPNNERMSQSLAAGLNQHSTTNGEPTAQLGDIELRRFPDGETYVRVETPVRGRDVACICSLDRPDDKFLSLFFLAATVRDLGARSVGLVSPYLAYMRQDRRFAAGEGITSSYFASLISRSFDWLITVDPHLHRRTSLAEIYSVPTAVVQAAPAVASWIRANVLRPLLVGPDEESSQWVTAVAQAAGAPAIVLEKVRRGDRDVVVTVPNVSQWRDHTPVLVDDIVSTARTMIETVQHLRRANLAAPVCVGVHAVFAAGAYDALLASGAARVVTCNTISHASNEIDLSSDIADGMYESRKSKPAAFASFAEQ